MNGSTEMKSSTSTGEATGATGSPAGPAPTVLDLFCGIGGLALGMKRAGALPIGGVDSWDLAGRTFTRNLGLPHLRSDLRETTASEIEDFFEVPAEEIDVIVGGPPCQGFSTVGKRKTGDARNSLWKHYLGLARQIRPSYVAIENVEGMIVGNDGAARDNVIRAFREIGYRMKARVLKSARYGVPQIRKRCVFLGWLASGGVEEPAYPAPTHTESGYVTVGEAISDLPELGPGEKAIKYGREAKTEYQAARRLWRPGAGSALSGHEAANHSEKTVRRMSHVSDGGDRSEIPDRLQPGSGYHNSYSRLASWKPAACVTSNMRKPSSARCTHPKQNRGLTVREGLRLQTFDDHFRVSGPRTRQYDLVGNAVPPFLAEAIGKEIARAFRRSVSPSVPEAAARGEPPLS